MDKTKYDEDFVAKYVTEPKEKSQLLYEYKSGEFQRGEVIGMQTTPSLCSETTYSFKKDTKQEHTQLDSFINEEGNKESDLQIPVYGTC